jgi:hypothetical protein
MKLKILHGSDPATLQAAFDTWAGQEGIASIASTSLSVRQQASPQRPLVYELAVVYHPIPKAPDLGD